MALVVCMPLSPEAAARTACEELSCRWPSVVFTWSPAWVEWVDGPSVRQAHAAVASVLPAAESRVLGESRGVYFARKLTPGAYLAGLSLLPAAVWDGVADVDGVGLSRPQFDVPLLGLDAALVAAWGSMWRCYGPDRGGDRYVVRRCDWMRAFLREHAAQAGRVAAAIRV